MYQLHGSCHWYFAELPTLLHDPVSSHTKSAHFALRKQHGQQQ